MDEIKKPSLTRPEYFDESYDYRNIENVGKFRGIGHSAKVGLHHAESTDAMPPEKMKMKVPRDHEG
ncbi:hypothetical protein UFOVP80_29 [uncultured Caudovirales phage]|jgi:hypothetical protein|uniref:Uncharacterized protein n=1 Tax=uncultured Caudovirales phage TaxID=2100421 RepID=A0A6J5KZP8_9CAUD|nr:hypothetical protein UFOVP80_29 [uncultured Caudovirales phage]